MLRNLGHLSMAIAHHHCAFRTHGKLCQMLNTPPGRFAARAPAVVAQALAPTTVWGMSMARAVASLQEGNLLTYEPVKVHHFFHLLCEPMAMCRSGAGVLSS